MLHQIAKDIIKNHGYTIKRIAKETGLSEKTIRLINAEKVNNPRSQTTLKLLNLYFSLQHRKSLFDKDSLNYFNRCYKKNLSQKNSINLQSSKFH